MWRFFCKHDWQVVADKTQDSTWEKIVATGMWPEVFRPSWFEKGGVVIVSCKKCGRIKSYKYVF